MLDKPWKTAKQDHTRINSLPPVSDQAAKEKF